jgi:cytochrome bd ubiquinol oxidase subunit II
VPDLSLLAAAALLASLVVYAITGGADFGGGVWDLLGSGPRKHDQRVLVTQAIAPIWETNHIWLIVAVVILFTAFPRAYAVVSTALFVPITLVLAGIVLRGGAFAFHSHALHGERGHPRWETVFAGASLLTPVLLGVTAGAIATGGIRAEEGLSLAPYSLWLSPFPIAAGLLTVAMFSFLAAAYLTLETDDHGLREDFRTRALWSARVVAVLAVVAIVLAGREARAFQDGLLMSAWSVPLLVLTGATAIGAYASLSLWSFRLARVCAAAQVALIVLGWGLAQYPYLVRPDVSIAGAAAARPTVGWLMGSLAAGGIFLLPAVFYLYKIFKGDVLFGRSPRWRRRL